MLQLKIVEADFVFRTHSFEYVYVDDGSTDQTFNRQKEIKKQDPDRVLLVKLTRNFGSYNSFLAGMYHASGDCNIYLHADLQDPPELIPKLFEQYLKGNKLVIANRQEREDGSLFSLLYHWMVSKFAIKNVPPGGFDLILFDRQIKEEIVKMSEKNTNTVYLISWLGYPYVNIPYKRKERRHGTSQWTFWKKVKMFADTFFYFSSIPITLIRASFVLSLLVSLVVSSLILVGVISHHRLLYEIVSLLSVFLFFNLLLIGEYLIRIYDSISKKPNFVVDEVL